MSLAQLVPIAKAGNPEMANWLREIADRVASGDVTEIAIVGNDRDHCMFFRHASFTDRWRLLGALEHAKQTAFMGDCVECGE